MSRIKIMDFVVSGALKSKYAADNPQVLDWIDKDLALMLEYHNYVYILAQKIQRAELESFDRESYQNAVMELDRKRTEKHDAAIAALVDLDSCTRQCGFGTCVNVQDLVGQNRSDIGDAIFEFCAVWVKRNKQLP